VVVLRAVKRLLPLVLAVVVASLSACTGAPPIPTDLVVTRESPSSAVFEPAMEIVAGSTIPKTTPLVLAYTLGRDLETGAGIAIVLPTSPPDEIDSLWAEPTLDDDEPGFVSLDEESRNVVSIERAGRVIGGGGQIELRCRERVSNGTTIRIRLSGRVPDIVPRRPIRLYEVDPGGASYIVPPAKSPTPPIKAAPAAHIAVAVPPDVVSGQSVDVRIAALDSFGNVDTRFSGSVALAPPPRGIEPSITFGPDDGGRKVISGVRFAGDGFARLEGTSVLEGGPSEVRSNPFRIWRSAPALKRFLGDPHFHTGSNVEKLSTSGGDHAGHFVDSIDAFNYLREVASLSWGASTEYDRGMSPITWADNQRRVEALNEPGKFVTLLGYEWTPSPRIGRHLVLFGDGPGAINPLVQAPEGESASESSSSVDDLVSSLRASKKRVLAVPILTQPFPNEDSENDDRGDPHEMWDGPEGTPAGGFVFNDLRRVGEIYSRHNDEFSSGGYVRSLDGGDDQPPLFEVGAQHPWTFQHAWASGHRIGVVAGSDNALGTPGVEGFDSSVPQYGGLTVVLARELNRGAVFDALYSRRCYATTGARIWLDLTVDGQPMGSEFVRRPGSKLAIAAAVAGTAPLLSAEIVIFDGGKFVTLADAKVDGVTTTATIAVTKQLVVSTIVYLRVRQADGQMAWSSPIWIDEGRL
jgi:hypothetical protein